MTQIIEYELHGACCANGIIRAKKAIAAVPGAGKVKIDLAQEVARVEGDALPEAVVEALQAANFTAVFIGPSID